MTKELQRVPEFQAGLAGTTNADKARALIALLERGGGPGAEGIPAARLRDWARDLVETVERAAPPPQSRKPEQTPELRSEVTPEPEPKTEPRLTASRLTPPRLFTKAPPVLVDRAPPAAPVTPAPAASSFVAPPPVIARPLTASPVTVSPVTAPPLAAYTEAARVSAPRMTLGAPVPHAAPRSQAGLAGRPAILSRQEVGQLVASTVDLAGDPASLGREHPAIVALTLVGKPTLQQAAVLRALPGAQMRAVHRALRQLEARPA